MPVIGRKVALPPVMAAIGAATCAVAFAACGVGGGWGGESPLIAVWPDVVLFEPTPVGGADLEALVIDNQGVAPLVITEVSIAGPGQVFRIADGYQGGTLTIEPEGSVELFLSYTPAAELEHSGTLVLRHNDAAVRGAITRDGVTRVPLQVRGDPPRLLVTPNPIDFGRVAAGQHAELTATITNVGGGRLAVTDYFVVGGNGVFTTPDRSPGSPAEPLVLERDQRHELEIAYEPADDGFDTALLVVKSNDADTEQGVSEAEILGNGGVPCVEVSPDDDGAFDFGERFVGRVWQQEFTVRNCSEPGFGAPLVVDGIALAEGSSSAYSLARLPRLPTMLQPGEQGAFTVEFEPDVIGQVELATLVVSSGDEARPELGIGLSGLGSDNQCAVARAVCSVDGEAPATELEVAPWTRIECDGGASEDADGEIVEYLWSLVESPDRLFGGLSGYSPARPTTSFDANATGDYVVSLEVVDERGCVSEPATVTVRVRPRSELFVELRWWQERVLRASNMDDLDLHFLHPNGCWENSTWDCHFRATEPNWGDAEARSDDPRYRSDSDAPHETVSLDEAEDGVTYRVAVHGSAPHGPPDATTFASVRIWVSGTLAFEALEEPIALGEWWSVASVQWPSGAVTPVDLRYDDVPPCR